MKSRIVALAGHGGDWIAKLRKKSRHALPRTEVAGHVDDAAPLPKRTLQSAPRLGCDPECSIGRLCGVEQGEGIREVLPQATEDRRGDRSARVARQVGTHELEVVERRASRSR